MSAHPKNSTYLGADYVVLAPVGALDFYSSPGFRKQVEEALVGRGAARLVCCDLSGVDFMDSTALGELVRARRKSLDAGARFCIVGASASCKRVLRWTQLDTVIPGFETIPEAIFAMGGD